MSDDNNKSSAVGRQPFDQALSTKLETGQSKSSVAPADNLNTANPVDPASVAPVGYITPAPTTASSIPSTAPTSPPAAPSSAPAVDDAPLPFGLKPPGSNETSAPTQPAATATPTQAAKESQSPSAQAPSETPQSTKTTTAASPSAAPAAPPSPPQQAQAPSANRFGFIKNIFQRKIRQAKSPSATTTPDTKIPSTKATLGTRPAFSSPAPVGVPTPSSAQDLAPQTVGKAAIIRRPTRRAALILEVLAGIIVAIVAVFFIFFYRAQININPTPAPDKIILDKNEVKAGNFKLKPGIHSIEITKEGYVTYRLTAEYKINQRATIAMPLIRATEPQTVLPGATTVTAAQNNKLAFFLTQDGQIAEVASEPVNGKFEPFIISNGSYLGAKNILYSADNTFALGQFDDGIKIISFAKPDALNQVEALLPLDAPQVSSITWNATASDFVPAANSQIVYDKNDGGTWNLFQSDLQMSKPTILMTIDPTRFNDIFLNWSQNTKKVLITGRELGVLDLGTRIYEKINENINFKWGIWGPQGKYAVVTDESGDSYVLSGLKVTKLDLKTAPNLVSWIAPSKAIIVSEGRPVQIDFDTMSRINYAEINGLKNAASFTVISGRAVFADNVGVKIAPLTENIYNE